MVLRNGLGTAEAIRVSGAGELRKRVVCDTHDAPFGLNLRSLHVVKVDGRLIPCEHIPLEPRASLCDGHTGQVREQRLADSLPTERWGDVQVLQPYAVVTSPCAVAGEEECKARRRLVMLCNDGTEARRGAEAIAQQVGFCRQHRIRLAFVERQFADEREHLRDVVRCGWSDVDEHGYFLSADFLSADLSRAASHLSNGSEKANSSCLTPFSSVVWIIFT